MIKAARARYYLLDVGAFLFLALGCLLLMAQSDINVTGDRSFLLFEHGLRNFYDASYQTTGGYGANYLPSTFLLFGLWNILPWLLGARPVGIGNVTHVWLTLWYKLLPCLFFLGSALIVYKILLTLGCKQKKALLGLYLFTTSPIAIFSQFVFVQYDSFTVFFVLLGIWLYLKKKPWGFILSLGVAATFKYYALVILVVFLLLRDS